MSTARSDVRALSGFGPGPLHYLRPIRNVLDEKFLKIGHRARKACAAEIGKATLHARLGEDSSYLFVEPLDDLGARALAQTNCPPLACLEARQEISDWWYLGQGFPARRGRYRERTKLASTDMLAGRRHAEKHDLHLTPEQVCDCCRGAAIRHMRHFYAG